MKLIIKEQTCHLLYERAVFWEEQKTLILADIHIGKATVFRKIGIPIPEGNMEEDLNNITVLIEKVKAEKCIIVGDLIHAKSSLTKEVVKIFGDWLNKTTCEIHLVMGNHDYSLAKGLPKEWPLFLSINELLIEPFYFSHFPMTHEDWFVWSGHIHPKIQIKGFQDRLVLRCFQVFKNLAILPAFGSFVGGAFVKKTSDCSIYAIADQSIVEL